MPKAKTSRPSSPRKRRKRDVPVVGWREWLSLPDFGIDAIKVKIDTGARTSAIHAFKIRPFTDRGVPWVSFVLRPRQRHRTPEIECALPVLDERKIRSSNGEEERRYVIETEACLGETAWPIELSLANRDDLGFRMLLGREAVRGRFLVNPDRSFLIGRSFADVTTTSKKRKKT
ncbi:MAG: ATP-dependent zinc protease [Alphaproteobacteria bacterium]|nr:ATP-dependent zinc protease [Alphaproteobacteria bacterium]